MTPEGPAFGIEDFMAILDGPGKGELGWISELSFGVRNMAGHRGHYPAKDLKLVVLREGEPTSPDVDGPAESREVVVLVGGSFGCSACGAENVAPGVHTCPPSARAAVLRKKLATARDMLISARGVLDGSLPADDCTVEEIDRALAETVDDGGEWPADEPRVPG